MALPTSPSVVVIENDISVFAPNVDSSVVGVVGFADKGPANKPVLITSSENLIRKFGEPKSEIPGQGLEGAIEILEATNQMYFVRAANSSAAQASATLSSKTGAAIAVGASPAFLVSGFNGVAGSSIFYSTYGNDGLFRASGIVETKAIVSSDPKLDTAGKVITAAFSREGNGPVVSYTEGDDIYLASKYAGSGAYMQLSSVSGTRDQGFRFITVDVKGDASSVTGTGSTQVGLFNNTAYGFTASSNMDFKAYSLYPGSGYNLASKNDGSIKGLSVELDNLGILDKLSINSDGAQVEALNINLQPSSLEYVRSLLLEDSANDWRNNKSEYIYIDIETSAAGEDYEGFPDTFGQKLSIPVGFTANIAQPSATSVDTLGADNGTPRFVKLVEGTSRFVGGDSGYQNTEDPQSGVDITALIGTASKKTGMYALDEDRLNISLAVVPGISDDAVQNALINLGESSKNFFALVAPPYGFDEAQDAIDWINGAGARTAALNNSYAAVYWPWVQVFNPFAGKEEWYDPSIFAARQCVFTDSVTEPWFAPAGFRRGRLTKPTATEVVVNQGDRDALYANNVNPVANEPTTGIVIFGQKTAQRLPTALDRVNVRRLMIYIRKVLLEVGKPFQFEPNDSFTWEQVQDVVNPFLSDLKARRAIVDGSVKCDSTTNTPLRVDRNELWCSVVIKPTKAAETVVFEVNLTSQSASIS